MEAERRHTHVANKSLFYTSRLISDNMHSGKRGDDYKKMPRVVVITLLRNRILFRGSDEFLTMGELHWAHPGGCEAATDRMLFIVVELDKVAARYNHLDGEVLADEALSWLYLLVRGHEEPRRWLPWRRSA